MNVQEIGITTVPVARSRIKFLAAIVSISIGILGLIGAEIYARHVQRFFLWPLKLRTSTFVEPNRLKIYNHRFYNNPDYFAGWPIKVEFFESPKAEPRYLFKRNLRMSWDGKSLTPTKPGEKIFWSSNSWGFRGAEFSPQKAKGVFRVVCLGASTTEGSQTDTETYPVYLQQELTKLIPEQKFEVINAGHHAQRLPDLLEILRQRVLPLSPDLILFYEASNNIAFHEFARLPHTCQIGECWLNEYGAVYKWLYEHSAIFVMITERLSMNNRIPKERKHWFDVSQPKKSEIAYRETLAEIVKEAKAHHIPIVLSSFITLANPNLHVSYAANPLVFNDLYKIWYPVTAREIGMIYDCFNRQSRDVARQYGVPYADVASDFPKHLRYFPFDLIHLSPAGNRLLARKFAAFLSQQVLLHGPQAGTLAPH